MAAHESRPHPGHHSRESRPARVSIPVLLGGLVLAYLPILAPPVASRAGIDLSGWGPASAVVWNWAAVAVLLVYVTQVERLGLDSLRLTRPTEQDLSWAGWLGGAAVMWHWVAANWIVPAPDSTAGSLDSGSAALVALGPLLTLILVITTSITEEILWRGYVVERLGSRVGLLPAAGIGFTIFAANHLPFFGLNWMVTVGPGALLLYVLLLWRRNLYACMLAHFIGNVPIFIVALTR